MKSPRELFLFGTIQGWALALLVFVRACPALAQADGAPVFTTQPLSQEVQLGSNVTLSATTSGFQPQKFQWLFQGTNLPGAVNSSVLLSHVQYQNLGRYQLIASNAFGMATSMVATLRMPSVVAWGSNSDGQTNVPVLGSVSAIAAGGSSSYALKTDGTVIAWGNNSYGQKRIPTGLSNVVAIAGGDAHCLALRTDGTVAGWGNNFNGQLDAPKGLSNVVNIAAGGSQSVALRADGRIIAWGSRQASTTNFVNALADVVSVSIGMTHAMGLRADGTVVAWGLNTYGQTNVPSGLSNVVAIAAGGYHCLALQADGSVVAWGNVGANGGVPAGLSNVTDIAAGMYHSLALKADGTVKSWNSANVLNVPTWLSNVVALAGGMNHSLALTGDGSPFITSPLVSRTVVAGSTLRMKVSASGALPLTYQWACNGTNLVGATNALLALDDIQPEQAGLYSVTVSNSLGSIVSPKAQVRVLPLVLTEEPQNQAALLGAAVALRSTAEGLSPISYQWLFNGTNLPGATQSTLTLTNARFDQSGVYSVIVSNSVTSIQSTNATVSIGLIAAWGRSIYGETSVPGNLTNVCAIAAGGEQSLALRTDGTVASWGQFWADIPAQATNVTAIATGYGHCLALRADRTVVSWGWAASGQTNVPPDLTNVVAVAGGSSHSLALKADGTVTGWGAGYDGQTTVPPAATNVTAIAAGEWHSLALRGDGTVVAWGGNSVGETNVPSDLTNAVAIAAGHEVSLAVRADGTVVAWGGYSLGQRNVPKDLTNAIAVACGFSGNCMALKIDGTVAVWGSLTSVPAGLSNIIAITAGQAHQLALTGLGKPVLDPLVGQIMALYGETAYLRINARGPGPLSYQWRLNGVDIPGATNAVLALTNLRLQNGGTYSVKVSNAAGEATSSDLHLGIVPLHITSQPQDQSAVRGMTVVLDSTGASPEPIHYQWQWNGVDLPGATNNPLVLSNAQPWQSGCYSAVLNSGTDTLKSRECQLSVGQVAVWGANDSSQLGYPPGLTNVVAIAAGHLHSLVLKADGTVTAWGDNQYGKATVPPGLSNVIAIAAGEYHSLALKRDGTVTGWGSDAYGQFSGAAGLTNLVAIAAGYTHSLGLTADGRVFAWGENSVGQTAVPNLPKVVSIAAGWSFSLALTANDTVVGWGENVTGQINVPGQKLHNVVAIAGGQLHSLALLADGTVVGWGDNYSGEITPPSDLNDAVAIAAGGAHSVALRRDGTVVGWGFNAYGQTDAPGFVGNVLSLSAGTYHTMALIGDGPAATVPSSPTGLLDRGVFRFQSPTKRGAVYGLEYKTSLAAPSWTSLPLVVGNGTNLMLTDPHATNSMQFYRLHRY